MTRRLLVAVWVVAALCCAADVRVQAQSTLPHTSLASYIVDLKARIPGSGTNAFVQPSQADVDAFRAAVGQLFAGNAAGANTAAHAASLALNPKPKSFNIHGNASSSVDVELSNGTRNDAASTDDVNRLRNALRARSVNAGSCNLAADRNGFSLNLCGTDNADGRLSNNSPEACGTAATSASGLFLHIEQHLTVRNNPGTLIAAIEEVFPEDGTPTMPAAPAGLSATAGNAQVALAWNGSSGATGYNVKRGTTNGGPYTTIGTGVTSTTYTDGGLTNGTAYYYVVSAVNGVGEGPNSSQASATPQAPAPPPAPAGLTATAGKKKVTLQWSGSAGATSYNVKRSTTSGGPYNAIASVTSISYNNTGLSSGRRYCFVVAAVNASGQSGDSNEACATPR